jgi:hypothetical protein
LGRKRCSRVTRLRKYSTLKRYPKRPRVIIKEDLGDAELVETISFPQVERVKNVVHNERNPNLVYVMKSPIRMAFYKDSLRGFIYDADNRFLGAIDLADIWTLYRRAGEILALPEVEAALRSETQSRNRIRRERVNDIDMGG